MEQGLQQEQQQSVLEITYVFHARYGKCELMDIEKSFATIRFPYKNIMTIVRVHRRLVFMNEGCTEPITDYIAENIHVDGEDRFRKEKPLIAIEKNVPIPTDRKRYSHKVFKYPTNDLEVGDSFVYASDSSTRSRARVGVHLNSTMKYECNKNKKFIWHILDNVIRVWRVE